MKRPGKSPWRLARWCCAALRFRAAQSLLDDIGFVASQSPFRQMVTPGGYTMSVAMTNCGALGWTTDRHGYCYAVRDPLTDKPWPALPLSFASVCRQAAIAAGYASFQPDACLINRYAPGAKLSLHQDKDEPDLRAPIISVSLGVPAVFSVWRPASQRPDPADLTGAWRYRGLGRRVPAVLSWYPAA
ncbi:AlkB protein [Salmonella enterica subsp. enterica]|uniref:AlkB protein n=1 Tax=Salmonella enterica I TaxID=59201 RepID=A0A3S5DCU1_SALET|nr:AlkB protein [Salmonella enterica subsp. enterica]